METQEHAFAEGPEATMNKIIQIALGKSTILTYFGVVVSILAGSTLATTVTVPSFIQDLFQTNWKTILAFGPVTILIVAVILSSILWGLLISLLLWVISKLPYFSKVPEELQLDKLSSIQTDALTLRMTKRVKKGTEWINAHVSNGMLKYKVNIPSCVVVVLISIIASLYLRS